MMNPQNVLGSLSNSDLLARTREIVEDSCRTEADLLLHLGEIDERKLYLERSFASTFAFCLGELRFSGCHLQPHPGGTRSATDSRDHRRNALRKGAPGRVAPARAAPHCRKSSRGARTGGGQVEARDRGAGRPTVTAAARCAIGAETSCASPSSRAARSGFESSRKASVETRRPSSKRRATWRRHVQRSVHGGPILSGEAPPRPGSIPAPDSGRGPDVHFRQGTRR